MSIPGKRKGGQRHTELAADWGIWEPKNRAGNSNRSAVAGVAAKPSMFVTRVSGTSMEPPTQEGSWCLFRPCAVGSCEGRIVLAQFASLGAGENGGRFTFNKYHSEKPVTADGWQYDRIQLLPLNPACAPIEIQPDKASDIVIVAE